MWKSRSDAARSGTFSIARGATSALRTYNIERDPAKARACLMKRHSLPNPTDSRVLYERDQLWKRIGERPESRLAELERHLDLANSRDDPTPIELCKPLLNQTRPARRKGAGDLFLFGRTSFSRGKAARAWRLDSMCARVALHEPPRLMQTRQSRRKPGLFGAVALDTPENLGRNQASARESKRHPLLARCSLRCSQSDSASALAGGERSRRALRGFSAHAGHSQFSELTYFYSALALAQAPAVAKKLTICSGVWSNLPSR